MAAWYRAGRTYVIDDTQRDPRCGESTKAQFRAIEAGAAIGVPLVKSGRVRAMVSLHQKSARHWTDEEITLLEETAERTWAAVERARAEAALRESEQNLYGVANVAPDLLWYSETDGSTPWFNERWLEYTGQALEQANGWGWVDAIHPKDREASAKRYREAVKLSKPLQQEHRIRRHTGEYRWFLVRSAPVLDEHGHLRRMYGAATDIQDQREAMEALRESEERFRQFADASAAGIWMRDAHTLEMEFVSPAVTAIYGVKPEALLGDVNHWASLIVPDDRELALKHLEKARAGNSVVHEFRIRRPSDGAFRWIRDTDFPLRDGAAIPRIGGIAEDVSEAKLAAEHQTILLAELQHRVRNIMAMIRSVARRTERSATSVQDYAALITGRVMSLARTQSLLTRAANADVEITDIVQTELEALAEDASHYRISGPQLKISPKAAEVLSLAIHELTTNALKYGALAAAEGFVSVRWTVTEENARPWLKLFWSEARTPAADWTPPTRRGFGTELIERRVPYELHGRGRVEVTAQGAQVAVAFPLGPGASILETGAPMRKNVFGGSIDMSGEPSLEGSRILILEDDYLLASDAESALLGAGAEIVGPFSLQAEAIESARKGNLSAAVVDINLGHGTSFEAAYALQKAGVPFIFVTGYDDSSIPPELVEIPRLVKPVDLRQLVRGLAQLVR